MKKELLVMFGIITILTVTIMASFQFPRRQDILLAKKPGKVMQGVKFTIDIHIENQFANPIIIWELNRQMFGNITQSGDEELIYNPLAQKSTQDFVFVRVLFPSETTVVSRSMKTLEIGEILKRVKVAYLELTETEMTEKSYILDEKEGILRHPTDEEVKDRPDEIILYLGENFEIKYLEYDLSLEVIPQPFTLQDAFEKVGFTSEEYTFTDLSNSWVLKINDRILLVNETCVVELANVELEVFDFVHADKTDYEIIVTEHYEISEDLKELFTNFETCPDPSGALHVYVSKDTMIDFLKNLTDLGCHVKVDEWYSKNHIIAECCTKSVFFT